MRCDPSTLDSVGHERIGAPRLRRMIDSVDTGLLKRIAGSRLSGRILISGPVMDWRRPRRFQFRREHVLDRNPSSTARVPWAGISRRTANDVRTRPGSKSFDRVSQRTASAWIRQGCLVCRSMSVVLRTSLTIGWREATNTARFGPLELDSGEVQSRGNSSWFGCVVGT